MPHHATLKSMCMDTVIFFGLFAIVGHMSINLWERLMIQTELTNMKTSLHTLKNTVNNIGYAYDKLHKEVKGLTVTADFKKSGVSLKKELYEKSNNKPTCNNRNKVFNNLQLQTKEHPKNDKKTEASLVSSKSVQNILYNTKSFPSRNVSTVTRYPPKSTGVGLDTTKFIKLEECIDSKENNEIHKCHGNYECYDNNCNNWKF
ncbi:uncharacterized protein LOC131842647 [Achroia grisella]|uniref:uncharacterized protein LOC131842647 n=1 Tax=Achroia grisella TaxID=688607 RepID=UPI0027D27959|nr:uncharacterized protein LOC131842647 [Achroia grisella]